MVMDQARKELKRQEDKQFSVFNDIPKKLYEIRKSQMKKFKEARGKGCTVYFSKVQPDKLFVNGKFIPASPLTDFVYVRAPLSTHFQRKKCTCKYNTLIGAFLSLCSQIVMYLHIISS